MDYKYIDGDRDHSIKFDFTVGKGRVMSEPDIFRKEYPDHVIKLETNNFDKVINDLMEAKKKPKLNSCMVQGSLFRAINNQSSSNPLKL